MAALFDFLKRKEEQEKAQEKAKEVKPAKKTAKVSATPKKKPASAKATAGKEAVSAPVKAGKKSSVFNFNAVKEPHISEKSTIISEKNQYTFKVASGFNKNEIKKSVEGLYGVEVLSVNIIKIPPKKRRIGRTEGFKKGYKKAVVKIAEGQKIEIL